MSHEPVAAADSGRPPAPRRLSLGKKLVFSLGTTVIALVLFELALWLIGVRPYRDVRDPLLGFAPGTPLFTKAGDRYQTSEVRLTYFNPQSFAAVKPKRGRRIFCLGESTTFGHPYRDRTSYVGWMREVLAEADHEHTWEVVNCGGISYASYRLARLMEELVNDEPDVFIIHVGHNEFLEERTYHAFKDQNRATQLLFDGVGRLRTATLFDRAFGRSGVAAKAVEALPDEVDAILDHTAGPTTYERDPQQTAQTVAHFRANLARMCRNARAAGAHVILVKPAGNLRDFSPFKSEYGVEDFGRQLEIELQLGEGTKLLEKGDAAGALARFESALAIDPQYARSAYLAGKAAMDVGDCDRAERLFTTACDEDVCPLRATSAILQAVDDVGREERVPVIDFPGMIARHAQEETGCRIPGAESFLDHVHPTIDMHVDLAVALIRSLADEGLLTVNDTLPSTAETIQARVTADLDQTEHALALSTVSQVLSWAGRTDEALRLAVQAAEQAPENVEVLAQLGRMYDKTSQTQAARKTYEEALEREPENPLILYRLARNWMIDGDDERAVGLLEKALEHTPSRAPRAHRIRLFESLATCYERLGRADEAAAMQRRAQSQ